MRRFGPWSSAAASCSCSPTSTSSSPACWRSGAVSALTYAPGALPAADQPVRHGRGGGRAARAVTPRPQPARPPSRERLARGHGAHHLLRRARRRAVPVRGRRHRRRAPPAGRVRRRRHPARLVHAGRVLARAPRHHPVAPAPERPLRPRPSEAGRAHRRAARGAGRPDRRHPHVPARPVRHRRRSVTERVGDLGSGPLPDALAAARERPARGSASSAWPSAPPLSSWVEYRLLRGALEWRIGPLAESGHDTRWSPHRRRSASACWPPGCGPSPTTCRAGRRWSSWSACRRSSSTSASPPTMAVTEARRHRRRLRRLLPG